MTKTPNYSDPRWQKLRLKVMERDNWKCVSCKDDSSTLHVHHKRYVGEIWESPIQDLQTLCDLCHLSLGPHPKAGMWYEDIRQIKEEVNVANNWHNNAENVNENAVALAVQNCPQCGKHDFVTGKKLLSCFCCGWSKQCDSYVFLHEPAVLHEQEELIAKQENDRLAKARLRDYGQLKTWARKCRQHGFSDKEIWQAVFDEHAVPVGYQFDIKDMLAMSVLSATEAHKILCYLRSGMTFQDIVWELAGISRDAREVLASNGY
jgi:hypothetical protein